MLIDNKSNLRAETSWHTFPKQDKVTAKQYKEVIDIFSILVFKAITEHKKIVKLPYGIGNIYLKNHKLKRNSRQVDFKHFLDTGEFKIVRRNSLVLDGYLKTTWDKRHVVAPTLSYMHRFIQFRPNRMSKKNIVNQYLAKLTSLVEYYT